MSYRYQKSDIRNQIDNAEILLPVTCSLLSRGGLV